MDNIRFLEDGTQVKLIRIFSVGATIYAEIQVPGEDSTRNVKHSELLMKSEFYQLKKDDGKLEETTQEEPVEIVYLSKDGISANSYKDGVISSMNTSTEGAVIKSGKIKLDTTNLGDFKNEIVSTLHDEEAINERAKKVIAISPKGKRFNLGNIDELSDNTNVKKFKLDPEAIIRCINGKQKQHKSYTFEVK